MGSLFPVNWYLRGRVRSCDYLKKTFTVLYWSTQFPLFFFSYPCTPWHYIPKSRENTSLLTCMQIFDRHKKPSPILSKPGHSFLGTKGSVYMFLYICVFVCERERRACRLDYSEFCGIKWMGTWELNFSSLVWLCHPVTEIIYVPSSTERKINCSPGWGKRWAGTGTESSISIRVWFSS